MSELIDGGWYVNEQAILYVAAQSNQWTHIANTRLTPCHAGSFAKALQRRRVLELGRCLDNLFWDERC
jgi:hypothetical protein